MSGHLTSIPFKYSPTVKKDRLPFKCPVTSFPTCLWCHRTRVTSEPKFAASLWGLMLLACCMFHTNNGPRPLQKVRMLSSPMDQLREVGVALVPSKEYAILCSETCHTMIRLSVPDVAKRSEFLGCQARAVIVLRCSATMECSLNSL